MNRLAKTLALIAPLAGAALVTPSTAEACGGCFVPPAENTVVSGHRMALSVSMTRTVLWDQIEYQGNPEDFTWVLPIKPGARIEQAAPEWFEALEAATTMTVQAPPLQCNGGGGAFGCGANGAVALSGAEDGTGGGNVTVIKQETVGPYDSVTLSSSDPDALTAWLESHGYDIPADVEPVIGSYVDEGFDFIALRLTPGNGVNLMTPVRVITDGASPVLPLRMVAAGTGQYTSIILYVLGEGRWTTENFPEEPIPFDKLTWDGSTNDSNYAELRASTLALHLSRTFSTTYAQPNALFGYNYDEDGDSSAGGNIGQSYLYQLVDDDTGAGFDEYETCTNAINAANQGFLVVDNCDPVTGECAPVGSGQLSSSVYTCGELTDLSTALVGMHPKDVWVTRLEANLARPALSEDLRLKASSSQDDVDNFHITPNTVNYECPAAPVGGTSAPSKKGGPGNNGTALVVVALGAFAAMLAARRRGLLVRA